MIRKLDDGVPSSPPLSKPRFTSPDLTTKHLFLFVFPLILFLLVLFVISSSTTFVDPLSAIAPLASYFIDLSSASVKESLPPSPPTKGVLDRSRIAVCLVGGARRFELTGPSIVENILRVYPNAELFLNSPLDENSFKFSLLKSAPRIAAVRIFRQNYIPETESSLRVLTASNSPNGIQVGLLQYFNLVEGCLSMIRDYQTRSNFTYDWIVRTRVDSFWSAQLSPSNFLPSRYLVPEGSSYGGLNDRLGIGNFETSSAALSRLSVLPNLASNNYTDLNSEAAFKAQLDALQVPYVSDRRVPFCVLSDRKYDYPPEGATVPVAALSSPGPLSGAKCRPCTAACEGECVGKVMPSLYKRWSWTEWRNGSLKLCDAHGEWEKGWEKLFDRVGGRKLAKERKRVVGLSLKECVHDFRALMRKSVIWDAPRVEEICRAGNRGPDK
ncbi:hypothetical protein LINPERHAP1_LOCUS15597 [Linum perenne]